MTILKAITEKLFGSIYTITPTYETAGSVLSFDVIEEVSISKSATVTNYPVEDNFHIIDYKYLNPGTIEVKGIIQRSSELGIAVMQGMSKEAMIAMFQAELEYYTENLVLVDITTKTTTYSGYTLENYEIRENYDNYSLFVVDMTFREVILPDGIQDIEDVNQDIVEGGVSKITELRPDEKVF